VERGLWGVVGLGTLLGPEGAGPAPWSFVAGGVVDCLLLGTVLSVKLLILDVLGLVCGGCGWGSVRCLRTV
jgi:hypothetical protein